MTQTPFFRELIGLNLLNHNPRAQQILDGITGFDTIRESYRRATQDLELPSAPAEEAFAGRILDGDDLETVIADFREDQRRHEATQAHHQLQSRALTMHDTRTLQFLHEHTSQISDGLKNEYVKLKEQTQALLPDLAGVYTADDAIAQGAAAASAFARIQELAREFGAWRATHHLLLFPDHHTSNPRYSETDTIKNIERVWPNFWRSENIDFHSSTDSAVRRRLDATPKPWHDPESLLRFIAEHDADLHALTHTQHEAELARIHDSAIALQSAAYRQLQRGAAPDEIERALALS